MSESTQIPPPDPKKPPLRANVFHFLRNSNTALAPMFPYTSAGDIVPAATLFWGGPNRETGVFQHRNSVDEVAICFASEKSQFRPGHVHVGSRVHTVGGFFQDPTDPEILMVIVVTQRQSEPGEAQTECLTFMCAKCQTPLLQHEFSAKVDAPAAELPGYQPVLETLTEGAICLEPFNADPARRHCPKCGFENPPFPVSVWGWDAYQKNAVAAERGRQQLLANGQQTTGATHAA